MAPDVGEPADATADTGASAHLSATLRTDGGARGNPGPAGAGFVLEASDGSVIAQGGRYLGVATNNVAEYEALVWGLEVARQLGVRDIVVLCDSELVVRQINGVYRVKHENLRGLFVRALSVLRTFETRDVRHVRRAENTAADQLVNEAIDVRGQVGDVIEVASSTGQTALFD